VFAAKEDAAHTNGWFRIQIVIDRRDLIDKCF
jgi:hypothetical protein